MKSVRTLVLFLPVLLLVLCEMADSIVFPDGVGGFQGHEFETSMPICDVCEDLIQYCTCVSMTFPFTWQRPLDMLCDDYAIDHQHDSSLPIPEMAQDSKDLPVDGQASEVESSGERTLSDAISDWSNGVFTAGKREEPPLFMDLEDVQDTLEPSFTEPPPLSSNLTSLYTPPSTEPPSREVTPPKDESGQVPLGTQATRRHRHTFTCVFCSSAFQCFKKEEIRLHYVDFHKMDPKTKAYPCHIANCSFSADNPTHLERHRPVHHKEKGYTCPVEGCGRTYTRRDNLRRHIENAENHPDASSFLSSAL